MSTPRDLEFTSEQQIIDDVQRLRRGWQAVGNWTLPQACYHLGLAPQNFLRQPAEIEPNAEQKRRQERLAQLNASGAMPRGLPIAPGTEPPPDAGDGAIDQLMAGMQALAAYRNSHADFGPFGPVPTEMFRQFIYLHSANHLSNFYPSKIDRRSAPRYANEDAMIADISRLQRGHTMGGRWSLPQMAWHINQAFPMPLESFDTQPALTEAQITRQKRWDYYIANGKPPEGFEAPAEIVPPANCSSKEVDGLRERLHALKGITRKFVRVAAGVMPIDRARGFMLAHGWWHLSCLYPVMGSNA
jgi:hypothetical protein